jgi:GDP-L-fucose synthase
MKILITGGNGYIASSIYNSLCAKYDITCISRNDFDLTASDAVNKFFQNKYFDVVIHCAVRGGNRMKVDSFEEMDANLTMYYNLLQHKTHYDKLIHFGSGAEIYNTDSPYGLSKRVINRSVRDIDNFYNLRIFAVFDENELDTRFIKANINRYIQKEPILVFEDKMMDFIYMPDLISIIEHYINNKNLPKEIDCIYPVCGNRLYLRDIAEMINNLDEYTVPVLIGKHAREYIGYNSLELNYIGLQQGITNVYNKIKKNI